MLPLMLLPAPQDSRSLYPRSEAPSASALTAQQTNLVRSTLGSASHLNQDFPRDPVTGRRAVLPLAPGEFDRFTAAWSEGPISCIRAMNRAIALVEEPRRRTRYVEAAFDLELFMDRRSKAATSGRDLVGIPPYLSDGYTDLGIRTSLHRNHRPQKILVDKDRLRPDLVCTKRRAVDEIKRWEEHRVELEAVLRGVAQSLRESVGFDERGVPEQSAERTVRLSESIAERSVNCRHLAILYQLRLQEAGISSRLVKGKLHLYSLKLKHAWNVVREDGFFALVDPAFSEEQTPFVLLGDTEARVYDKAAELRRVYIQSPDSFHQYEIRSA